MRVRVSSVCNDSSELLRTEPRLHADLLRTDFNHAAQPFKNKGSNYDTGHLAAEIVSN